MSINERISQTLVDRGISQKSLASAIDVSTSTLNNWLKHNSSIPSEYLIPICEYLRVDIHWLLLGKGNRDTGNMDSRPSSSEESNALSVDEKVLVGNYRAMSEKSKIETIKQTARTALKDENKKLLASQRFDENSEFGIESSDIG